MAKKTARKVARKKTNTRSPTSAAQRSAKTMKSLAALADGVVRSSQAGREPCIEIPTRSAANTRWNKSRRILQMGKSTQERQLFNLSQARRFMQTMLHASSVKELLEAEKTLSLRAMFYKSLHTISGTKEKTFNDQGESDGLDSGSHGSLPATERRGSR